MTLMSCLSTKLMFSCASHFAIAINSSFTMQQHDSCDMLVFLGGVAKMCDPERRANGRGSRAFDLKGVRIRGKSSVISGNGNVEKWNNFDFLWKMEYLFSKVWWKFCVV